MVVYVFRCKQTDVKSRTFVKAFYGVVGKGNQELGRSSQVESQGCTRLTRFLDQLKSVQRRSKCVKTVQMTQQIKVRVLYHTCFC